VRRVAAFVCLREILSIYERNGESTERGTISEIWRKVFWSVACRKEQFTGMTGMQINVFGVFSKTIEKGDPKEWLLEFILLFQLYAFVGGVWTIFWGEGVASLETGLRSEASGAKIDVGQNLVAPRG
jgi:hypothetical protein